MKLYKKEGNILQILSFPNESHIPYYKKHARGIVIVRVLHQHMDLVKHL